LGALALSLEVLDLSRALVTRREDFHAGLAALPHLRVLLFSGGGGGVCDPGSDGFPSAYFEGMAEQPSPEHVRLQPDNVPDNGAARLTHVFFRLRN